MEGQPVNVFEFVNNREKRRLLLEMLVHCESLELIRSV